MKKNNKKKLLIIFLFLFALAGVVGYGVYSYYYTTGEMDVNSDTVDVISFDPEVYIDGNSDFLGSGGTVTLSCPDSSRGGETITCTGSITVQNEGGSNIYVEVEDTSASSTTSGYINASTSNPDFSWTSMELAPGESETLDISVDVSIENGFYGGGSDEAVEVSSRVPGGSVSVSASFKLKATQSH